MIRLTHPVRHSVPVPRGQGLQGPSVVVQPQPVGLPSGQPGAVLPHRPAASRTICIPAAHPVGPHIVVEEQLIFRVRVGRRYLGCGGLLLWWAVRLLVRIEIRLLEEKGRGSGSRLEINLDENTPINKVYKHIALIRMSSLSMCCCYQWLTAERRWKYETKRNKNNIKVKVERGDRRYFRVRVIFKCKKKVCRKKKSYWKKKKTIN